jgi:hypothetical protein
LNQVDTFHRNDFLNIISNSNNHDQKTLIKKLIQERNRLVVDLSEEFAEYFESILEQNDILLHELADKDDDVYMISKIYMAAIAGGILQFFAYGIDKAGLTGGLKGIEVTSSRHWLEKIFLRRFVTTGLNYLLPIFF